MERFLEPNSVAVIGASTHPGRGGHALVMNLKEKFGKRLYPVNPKHQEVCGLPCFKSANELPESVDLAIVFVPAPAVPKVLEDCVSKGIYRVMIQSAGFAETGAEGRMLQERCVAIARESGMRLWGPNCMGVVNGQSGIVASFMRPDIWGEKLRAGGVSLIVQSGMLSAGFLMQILGENYFGLSKACSIGNRCDVNECDLLEYMVKDATTKVVALYLESIVDAPRFRSVVSALNRPVVLLKGGISPEGSHAAESHTASLAGDSQVAEGLFRQLGIHRARGFLELMDFTKALVLWRGRKGGRRIAVVTFSGAAGIVASDHLVHKGMSIADLSPRTVGRLRGIFPGWMPPQNPVDIWPAVERNGSSVYGIALDALLQDPGVDGIYLHLHVDAFALSRGIDFLQTLSGAKKPVALWVIGDPEIFSDVRDYVEPMGTPVFREIERGAAALCLMAESEDG